ncbi:MAG: hypothetical protein M1546_17685, partial [Chloroflexi bacterium]|nr:hypothetical protein [Chloroflexota bacterium]
PLASATGIPTQPPFEWLWADHAVDTEPPQFVGINSPQFSVGPGANVIRGYASDPSGVPLIQVQVRDSLGVVTTLTCPDATPDDGQWTCDWPIGTPVDDGDEFFIRAQATDGLGHVSAWTSPWRNLIVDTQPPTVTLDTQARAAV